jgi:hypothetical protein
LVPTPPPGLTEGTPLLRQFALAPPPVQLVPAGGTLVDCADAGATDAIERPVIAASAIPARLKERVMIVTYVFPQASSVAGML